LAGVVVCLLVGALLLWACDDDSADDPSDDDGSDPTSTTLSQEDQVEAAYLAFWDMFVRLAQAPDPSDPEIPERSSGEIRQMLVDGLTMLQSLNRHSEFGPAYRHEVISVALQNDGTALVRDCAVDDSRLVESDTGQVVEEGVVTELSEVTLIHGGLGWQADHSARLDAWEGAVECE